MYICKECKTEYKEKVEYCDCGNNTFDYVQDEMEDVKSHVGKELKPLTLEEKSELVSRIFFALCIILSIIVWLIPVGKAPKTDKSSTSTKVQTVETKSIPNIDKIWNDTPLYRAREQQIPQPQQSQQVQQSGQIQTPLDKIREEIPLTSAPIKNDRLVSSSVQKKNNELVKSKTKNSSQQVQKSRQPQTQVAKSVQPKNNQNVKASTTKLDEKPLYKEPQKPTYNPNSQEMLRYKNNLRAEMFKHFAVGSIAGSGECSVQFAVNSDGKLINRKFSKESSNKALNDAVYYMLMSVPRFSPPPAQYNAQTIRMHFKIDNGNYEISIY